MPLFHVGKLTVFSFTTYFNWTALLKDYFILFNINYCYLPVDVEGCTPSSLPLVMFLDVGSDGLGPTFSGVSPTTSNSTSFSRSSLQKNTYAFEQPSENQKPLCFSRRKYVIQVLEHPATVTK